MSESDPVRESVTALSRFFVGDGTLSDTLQRVVELADRAVAPADITGLTMLVDGKPSTAFCSDDEAREIDQAQYETGSGPCLQAFDKGEVYTIESTESDDRWPEFCASAAAHGILSTMSLPLQASDRSIGALNFYSRERAAFRPDHETAGRTFADQAAIALANAQAYWEAFSLSQTLGEAMKTRAVI